MKSKFIKSFLLVLMLLMATACKIGGSIDYGGGFLTEEDQILSK